MRAVLDEEFDVDDPRVVFIVQEFLYIMPLRKVPRATTIKSVIP